MHSAHELARDPCELALAMHNHVWPLLAEVQVGSTPLSGCGPGLGPDNRRRAACTSDSPGPWFGRANDTAQGAELGPLLGAALRHGVACGACAESAEEL